MKYTLLHIDDHLRWSITFWGILIIGFIISIPTKGFSQKLSELHVVGKGKFLPSQLIDKSVKDANGQECAGLIIVSDLDGLRFDSYNGIVKRNHKPGQDFLFLSSDERVVTIYKSGFAPLKIILNNYGIQLKKGQVWQLKITGNKPKSIIPINIITQPRGAKIYIDSTRIDQKSSDSLKSQQVSRGAHTIKIIKDGYYTIAKKINVTPDKTLFTFRLKKKQLVPVEIKSIPKGANIYLNNVNVGVTDNGLFRYPGKYTIRLSKSGYRDTTDTISVKSNSNNQFVFRLNQNIGKLHLILTPKDAHVSINNTDYSGKSMISLIPGPYNMVISKTGYDTLSQTINIALNKTLTKNVILKRKKQLLPVEIKSIPKGASIYVNKINVGVTDHSIFRYPGKYTIRLSKSGYKDTTAIVTVKSDSSNQFVFHLSQNTGTLHLVLNPKDANITINNTDFSGENTINLMPGPYKIVISKDGYYSQSGTVNIALNKTLTKEYDLKRKTGTLQFSIVPLDAQINLMQNGKIVRSWRGLNYIDNLPVGKYKILAQSKGYFELTDTLQVRNGITSVKSLYMKPLKTKKGVLISQNYSLPESNADNSSRNQNRVDSSNKRSSFHSFTSVSFGIGNSYGNMGLELGYRIGAADFHIGVGSHIYEKSQNYSQHGLLSGGIRFILAKSFTKNQNFGFELYLDMQYGSLAYPTEAYGPSGLLGGTLWFGKTVGITTSWGISYNTLSHNSNNKYMMAGDLVGLTFKL